MLCVRYILSDFDKFEVITSELRCAPVQWCPPKVMGRSLNEELQVHVDIVWTWVSLALSPGLQVASHHIVLRSLSQILLLIVPSEVLLSFQKIPILNNGFNLSAVS